MQISDRLKLVISFVAPCGAAADIGTDHAYVPIALVKAKTVKRAFALDINRGPLERARKHIEEENLSEWIETRQSDGLEGLCENEADSIIIAGMGGELIANILEKGEKVVKTAKELVLSPHSEVFLVRKYLVKNGYQIVREQMIFDMGKYYTVLKAVRKNQKNNRTDSYDEMDYLYGKRLIEEKDAVLKEYLIWKKRQQMQILQQLEGNTKEAAAQRREELQRDTKLIDEVFKKMACEEKWTQEVLQ
ncbi:MAG: SAM-dependent methyltransferase [Lachnospiraceae bacterium]|nr:SAM-dependent methyltransferase [Lachnospiraceae bacterium]